MILQAESKREYEEVSEGAAQTAPFDLRFCFTSTSRSYPLLRVSVIEQWRDCQDSFVCFRIKFCARTQVTGLSQLVSVKGFHAVPELDEALM